MKPETKARKRQIKLSSLLIVQGLIGGKTGLADAWHALDIHFERLGQKTPQDKMLFLDIKVEIQTLLKPLTQLKSNQHKGALADIIAKIA